MDQTFKQALIGIVGRANFTDSLIDLISYSYDASDHDHRPDAALWPTCPEEVFRILQLADRYRFSVIPRGAGTGLAGGAVPISGGIILDMSRMNKIIEIRIPDRLVILQPGVVYDDLERTLAPHGIPGGRWLWWPQGIPSRC